MLATLINEKTEKYHKYRAGPDPGNPRSWLSPHFSQPERAGLAHKSPSQCAVHPPNSG